MENIFMSFIVYAFIGWLWESFYCSIKAKHFVYRGFLLGPYCPVYGFGVVAVLLLVPDNAGSLINLYFNMVVIVTVIEYVTSWLLEKLFHMTLWNYKNIPLNIDGRVAIPVSLFWGIGCLILVKLVNPVIQLQIKRFVTETNNIGPIILMAIFLIDVVSTMIFTATAKKKVESVIDTSDVENAAIKEFRLKHLVTNHKSSPSRDRLLKFIQSHPRQLKHHNLNRLLKNYPNITFKNKNNPSD
ncbi:putative ABC transporter permease [Vagococcus vulneris]|uniref:ABC transporter permease n=1 Tax=Vagococcus vulneris TaxID=1977869 RepID=A0A429ZZI0_9ENTE|nr:hypothetical protein [Vagococcus vulneris]RST99380.1 hypothetical protein CBF37_05260 [Vagococcus vulneris]